MALLNTSPQQLDYFFGRVPRNILASPTPSPFWFDEVPLCVAQLAYAYNKATGFDQSGIMVAAVASAAALIDDRIKLQVSNEMNWKVGSTVWAALLGGVACGKSPSIRAASDPIKEMHILLSIKHQTDNKGREPEERDPRPSLFTSDATVPALADILKDNPQGGFILTEEFASWIGAIETGDKGATGKQHGDYLQLRDGGARQIDRVGTGNTLVPNWVASLLAASTVNGLASNVKQLPDDGLMQRIIFCFMSPPNLDAKGDCRNETAGWRDCLYWIHQSTFGHSAVLEFSADAQELFMSERRNVLELAIATEAFAPSYAGHLSKHPGMLAEIALVFHVLCCYGKGETIYQPVSVEALGYAIKFMQRVRKHSYYLYSVVLSKSPAFDLAQSLARSIAAFENPIEFIARNDMTQHCGEFKKAVNNDRLRREAVQLLEDADWLRPNAGERMYSGWPTKYHVNPRIFPLYAHEGEMWRKRRAAVKDAIGGD